jgi:hypothetical protein
MSNEQAHPEHAGASVKLYTWIAIILAIFTAVEVAVLFVDVSAFATAVIAAIYVIMLIKFALVAAFFMHLRYDSKWFSILFVIGMLLAVGTYLALEAMVTQVPPLEGAALRSTPPADPAPAEAAAAVEDHSGHSDPAAGAASAAADSAAGPRQFSALGCGACHVVSGVAGAVGAIGPSLDGLGDRAGSRVAGQDADTYLRTSLLDPNAYVVEGYMKMMPPVAAALGEAELAEFIAWLKSL